MGYKLKRIMMRPNGVEKQVRPQKTIIYDDDVSLSTGSGGYAYTTITITAPSTNISFKLNCTSLEGPSTNPYGPVYGPKFSFNGTTVYSGALPIIVGGELEDTFTISGTGTITCTIDYYSRTAWAWWNGHLTVYAS